MPNNFSSGSVARMLRRNKALTEAEFQALFQLISGPALLVDRSRGNVNILQANSAFLQVTAFSLNELIGKDLLSLVKGLPTPLFAGDDRLYAMLERRNRDPLRVVAQIRALDPEGQWLALLFDLEQERQKNLTNFFESLIRSVIDLNQVKEGESQRKNLERGLTVVQKTLDVTAVAIYRIESGNTEVWKSAEAGEPDLLPQNIPPSDLQQLSQTFIWRPGRRMQTELHRQGRIHNLTFLASTPIHQNGLLVIGERKQEPYEHLPLIVEMLGKQFSNLMDQYARMIELRRQALEHRRELSILRSLGENAEEGVLMVSPKMTISEMNPAAEWMLGYADWEVKGQPVENILIGPDRLMPALETALEGLPTHNMGNVSLHRRNGQSFPAHIQVVPVQREGETLAILVFFTDVSEHEEIRNRTQQLEQRAVLGEVTAVFAHEVRNPINNISTGLQLLSVKLPGDDPNQENINRLLNDCQRLNHLMESVLNFSRQAEHKFESVDLNILLGRLLERWRPRMAKVNVTHYFQVEPTTPHILGDPRSLEQVFTNLVSNAVEAMSANGGTLAVRVTPFNAIPERPQVEVTVSDSGPGIPDEVRERIFEPFITTKSQGTGLGLAITKRIVTAHHGSISVNTFPGGTVFHVLLSAYQGEME